MKIDLAAYQRELLTNGTNFGMLMLLWRRQGGKTTTFAWKALRWMLENPGCLVTFSTCSLALGGEMTERETAILTGIIDSIRAAAGAAGKIISNADGLDWFDIADLYQHNRLDVSLWHDRTTRSRTKIIAASYATARGYSGYVLLDEVGFIRDFKSFFEAVEPVFSRNPNYRLWLSTTPPADDSHFSYELSAYPPGKIFLPNPRGNWYKNDSGMPIHRVCAEDAELAGVRLYDSATRQPVTPAQHRAHSLDRSAWDRNYGLVFVTGGTSAVALLPLSQAQAAGAAIGCRYAEDDLPADWDREMPASVREATVGADPATTENEKSNPFGVAVTTCEEGVYQARLLFRFRSSDPYKCRGVLRSIVERLKSRGIKVRCVVIDATSEKFWAVETRDEMSELAPFVLMVNSERTEYLGESMTFKTYLGNIASNAIADRQSALPPDRQVKDDFRLVKRLKGGFDNEEDHSGNHGDMFDAYKNSIHGWLVDALECQASAVAIGERSAECKAGSPTDRMPMRAEEEPSDSRASFRA